MLLCQLLDVDVSYFLKEGLALHGKLNKRKFRYSRFIFPSECHRHDCSAGGAPPLTPGRRPYGHFCNECCILVAIQWQYRA